MMSYYDDKIATLQEIFGENDVEVKPQTIRCGPTLYPVVDDVIILLPPAQRPDSLEKSSLSAPDIQRTFGAEWRTYGNVLAEHENEFTRYFDLVDLNDLSEKRVADLGCGSGRWSHYLFSQCREIVLVDFSEAIFVARENLRNAKNALFFMGDVSALPFCPDFCDFLFSVGVLHHLPLPCLEVVRSFRPLAPRQLFFLYYAFDNRPVHYRILLAMVTAIRQVTCRIENPFLRKLISKVFLWTGYLPLVQLGRCLKPLGWSSHVPLYDFYHDRTLARIEQDVYDRFFTRIEQRVTRKQVSGLEDTYSRVTISDQLPYWHFLCER